MIVHIACTCLHQLLGLTLMYSHTRIQAHTYTHSYMWYTGQMITQPPVSTTAALGTNVTFSCHGIGRVLWLINGTQVRDASQPPVFVNAQVFIPLPRDSSSELIITATRVTNATLVIICLVDPVSGVSESARSDPVQLLVYGMSIYCNIHSCI